MKQLSIVLPLCCVLLHACVDDITLLRPQVGEGDDPGECSDQSDNDLDGLWDCERLYTCHTGCQL